MIKYTVGILQDLLVFAFCEEASKVKNGNSGDTDDA